MKLSTRGNYGVRAAYELALNYGKGPLSLKQISERQDIPHNYLEQLLLRLKKGGIIESVRGPSGGYLLADNPEKFSIGDILRVLEGPFQMSRCIQSGNKQHCPRMKSCISIILWSRIEEKLSQALDEISLSDLSRFDVER